MRSLTGTPSAGYLGGSKLLGLSVLYYKQGGGRINGDSLVCKTGALGMTGSIPVHPTIIVKIVCERRCNPNC